jgi:DNA-binding NtrC family response regulator
MSEDSDSSRARYPRSKVHWRVLKTPDDNETKRVPAADSRANAVDEHASDIFIEHLTAARCLRLLQWARRGAPHLLQMLVASYLAQDDACSVDHEQPGQVSIRRISANRGGPNLSETKTLKAAERDYIAQVLSASSTLSEAAERLGIHFTTLWRKRKLYKIGQHPESWGDQSRPPRG